MSGCKQNTKFAYILLFANPAKIAWLPIARHQGDFFGKKQRNRNNTDSQTLKQGRPKADQQKRQKNRAKTDDFTANIRLPCR